MTQSTKKLILNADDYGACEAVNTAIEELALAGLLGGVSVLVNGEKSEAATEFLHQHPQISAGIHLNLIEGKPTSNAPTISGLLGKNGSFPGRNAILLRWMLQPLALTRAVEIEWRAQIERLLQAGLRLTHADSHQHLHAFPPAFRLAVKLCREYGIPALRLPLERNQIKARQLATLALNTNLKLARSNGMLKHNDHFLGFKRAGEYSLTELLTNLESLQEGVTEIALHPSTENFRPYPKLRGDDERRAILSEAFQAQLQRLQIKLIHWHEL
jgi:chitin disaccharide deacetylase